MIVLKSITEDTQFNMLQVENKLILSWEDVNVLIDKLAIHLSLSYMSHIDSITGIARGGLIPAVLLSHKTGIPYTMTVGPNTLVVDDICDTGETLKNGIGVNTAVLIYKPHTSNFRPDVWGRELNEDKWVHFPWENKNAKPIQDYLNK